MSDDLHDRLADILWEVKDWRISVNDAIAQIDQAYLEDGYFKPADVYGNKLMTGQEWYERFEKEFKTAFIKGGNKYYVSPDTTWLLEAAKRAAGLD